MHVFLLLFFHTDKPAKISSNAWNALRSLASVLLSHCLPQHVFSGFSQQCFTNIENTEMYLYLVMQNKQF